MIQILLFQCQCVAPGHEGFLGSEWMASAVGISITYIVFVMGIPAILFQTFIPEALRNIYNERFDNRWANFFKWQLLAAILLFFLSDPMIYERFAALMGRKLPLHDNLHYAYFGAFTKADQAEACVALIVLLSVVAILYTGYLHLMRNFKHSRNIALQLSKKIVDGAIRNFDQNRAIEKRDLEDLSVLAKELKAGQTKNQFLEECERLIEHILDAEPGPGKSSSVKKLLEEAVCRSITYESTQATEENRLKALEILMLVHGHTPTEKKPEVVTGFTSLKQRFSASKDKNPPSPNSFPDEENGSDYLHELIGYYVKEVGVAAMQKQDTDSVNEAVEKLYTIDADPKELFSLGDQALNLSKAEVSVAALQKLKSKSFPTLTPELLEKQTPEEIIKAAKKSRRTLHFWLGLLAKVHLKGGAAREYAERQWSSTQVTLEQQNIEIPALFEAAYRHFYRLTDFSTADDVISFQTYLLKK